ncbi:hypothetical protein BC832DRAFT_560438 [Gaertneriomyces semiglobifer]|nr:hypothetical protein BC832DRAFT_560438 [Gaertneriomyces semiglobifer]
MVDEEEEKENYALAIKEANVLESMYEHVGLIEPEKTSEPTFTARYIWPLLTFMNGTKSNVDIDISTDSGAERPDIHVWTRKKNLKRVILEGEVKTSWASESAREKEVPRVISKVMAAFRSEISLTYNDTTTPKIALSIQGTTGRVYYVFLFERLFVAYFAGYLNAITHLDETETVLLEKCLSGWKELGGRSDGIRRALKVPEKTPSKSAAKRLLPPNPEQYNLKLF